jgi:hypothetical protein
MANFMRFLEKEKPEFLPESLDVMGLMRQLALPSSQTIENLSYGNSPFTMPPQGTGSMIPQVKTGRKPEVADLIGLISGGVPGAKVAADSGVKISQDALIAYLKMIRETPPVGAVNFNPEQVQAAQKAVQAINQPRASFVPNVEAGKELIVHHNITPEKLAKVEKVGGMPVPSLAISNVENPLMGFGDISLIGSKEMAAPSAKNPVFGFDAYTARAPRITYKFDAKSEKNLQKLFSDVEGDAKSGSLYNLIDSWENREFSDLMRAKFLKEKGDLPNPKDFKNEWDFSRAIQVATDANYPEYKAWVGALDSRLADAGVNIQEKIFKGFSPSGNRKYAEANLENLVKEMKGGAGSEGINYGVGNLRAVATPRFKNLDQIKTSREKIIPQEQFKKVKDEINEAYSNLSDRISELEDQSGYGYKAADVLYDIGQAKNVNLLDRFKVGATDELKADIGLFIKKLQKMPTEYFEIKPQRAVSVSEFQGAIVPADTSKRSIDYLRNQGINDIYFYSTPEERKELFKKFGDKMFSAAPAIPAAGLLDYEER